MAGRPTSLTPEVQARICDAIRTGNYYTAAAAYGGISYAGMRNWINRGTAELTRLEADARARPRASEAPFVAFLEAVTRAEADAEVALVAQWRSHAPQDWRAARDLLARRFPDRWGPVTKVEHASDPTAPLRVQIEYANDWRPKLSDGAGGEAAPAPELPAPAATEAARALVAGASITYADGEEWGDDGENGAPVPTDGRD